MAKTVLLVDDVSMFLELQKDYLQLSAVNIKTARDGMEALQICKMERPAMVVMDLHMPNMNGADCCRAIKRDPELRSTPVILVTSEGKEEDRLTCLNAGCDDFLTKPLDRHIYLEAARRQLPAIDRRDKRIACHLKVKFRAFGITLSGVLVNLSQNGAYLATDSEVAQGTAVDLLFSLPEPSGWIVQTRGRVAWSNGKRLRHKPSLPEGFGVEFVDPPEEAAREIGRYIESEMSFT